MPEGGVNAIGLIVDYLLEHDLCTADERAFFELDQKLLNHTDGSGIGIKSSDEYFGPLTVIGGTIKIEDDRFVQTLDSRFPTSITADEITERLRQLASEIGGSFENTLLMEPCDPGAAERVQRGHRRGREAVHHGRRHVRARVQERCQLRSRKAVG